MTLGPALLMLRALDERNPRLLRPALIFGRVPLFYFVLHLPLIHLLAVIAATPERRRALDVRVARPWRVPVHTAAGLGALAAVDLPAVGRRGRALYPVCAWFAGVKRRQAWPWLSYL